MLDDNQVNSQTAAYVADRRLYLDKDGNVVEHDNPARVTLLVAEGGRISYTRARALGLLPNNVSDDEAAGEKQFSSLFKGAKGEAENLAMATAETAEEESDEEDEGTENKEVRRNTAERQSATRVEDKEARRADRK